MADWVRAGQDREQIVLFHERLDQAIAGGDQFSPRRLLDTIVDR